MRARWQGLQRPWGFWKRTQLWEQRVPVPANASPSPAAPKGGTGGCLPSTPKLVPSVWGPGWLVWFGSVPKVCILSHRLVVTVAVRESTKPSSDPRALNTF